MKYRKPTKSSLFLRWSYSVPLLSYLAFFLLIWTLSLPLSPFTRRGTAILNTQWNKPEDSFEIRMKNSNFNSDKVMPENEATEESKNEYLVDTNNKDNANKDQNEILQNVFTRYVCTTNE